MILDYIYNERDKQFSISYVKDNGGKSIMNFNVSKFKTYYRTSVGKFTNWDGAACDVKYTAKPHRFDIKTFLEEMDPQYKSLLQEKTAPKLYTFDIEVDYEQDVFPDPAEARFPILTISIVSPTMSVVVLGLRELSDMESNWCTNQITDYIDKSDYYKSLGLPAPTFRYIQFKSEREMLTYFLKNIVAKAPVLAGWNSLLFDWQYIQNRIMYHYQDISIAWGSINNNTYQKKYEDQRGNPVRLTLPAHTLILDMMDVVGNFDMVVMPIKESLSLEYIASSTIKMHKIEYDGDLKELYNKDYAKYVFYNAIDSILVQLIDKYFKTMQNIYTQALYCKEKIGACFSKIALTEALVWDDFYKQDIKVVPDKKESNDRGDLVGAYVRQPIPGMYKYICCNDFASLYPSTIITCNLSYENYIGNNYSEDILEEYRKKPDYFVSVNGCIYKNDKVYSFKRIQSKLKANRNTGKYLAKQLEATVITDLDHIIKGKAVDTREYSDAISDALKEIGYNIKSSNDLYNIENKEQFRDKLEKEITFYTSFEQSMKLLGNSMYGGSSHVAFFWFNMNLANDITGEARNLIHLMEKHIPAYLNEEWAYMKNMHELLNISVDIDKCNKIISQGKNLANIVYGDTDSVAADTKIRILQPDGIEKEVSIEDLYNKYGCESAGVTMKGHESVSTDVKVLNWSEEDKLYYGQPKRIIRHKVSKSKWKLRTKSGKEIIVTNDHSMIVFRDNKKIEVKPAEIKKTDKILSVKIQEK